LSEKDTNLGDSLASLLLELAREKVTNYGEALLTREESVTP
jgi:hypothetical protein